MYLNGDISDYSVHNISRREREAFHSRLLEARLFKTKVMSINIDGMDQQTTQLPSFAYKDKDTEDGLTQVHLTGEITR